LKNTSKGVLKARHLRSRKFSLDLVCSISLSKNYKPFNFVIFRPKKTSLGVEPKLKKAEGIEIMLDSAGLDVLEYDTRNQRYRVRFSKDEIAKHERLLKGILNRAYCEFTAESSIE